MRCALAVACMSFWGFQSESYIITSLAVIRLIPTPPALVDIKNISVLFYSSQNLDIAWCRMIEVCDPLRISQLKCFVSRNGLIRSSIITNCENMRTFFPYFLNLSSSFSNKIILPLLFIKMSSSSVSSLQFFFSSV